MPRTYAGRAFSAVVICVLVVSAGSSWPASAIPSEDVRAVAGAGTVSTCSDAALPVALAGRRLPRSAVAFSYHRFYVDITAVPGWQVSGIVVTGREGFTVYQPGQRGLGERPPWRGLRAPSGADAKPSPALDGFVCGTRVINGPSPTEAACARLLGDRSNFYYRVNGLTYGYSGFIQFPTMMTQGIVVAKPDLVIPQGCELPFSLAAYETQGPTWADSGTQTFLDHDSGSITADSRSVTLRVTGPRCHGQTDLYPGSRIYDGGTGSGHGPVPDYDSGTRTPRWIIGAWNGGERCDTEPTPTAEVTPTPTPTPTPTTLVTPTPTPTPSLTTVATPTPGSSPGAAVLGVGASTAASTGTAVLGTKQSNVASGGDSAVAGTKTGAGVLPATGASSTMFTLLPTAILMILFGLVSLDALPARRPRLPALQTFTDLADRR